MEFEKKTLFVETKDTYIVKNNYYIFKRFMDIVLSLIALILFSILFIVVAMAIKIGDFQGTIFFKQTRIGENGEVFKMYKFRSMQSNAEQILEDLLKYNEVDGHMFKMKEDPRVTKIGKFIRKYSIDELPQLYNVLKGDMSLVGPRPALESEVGLYTEHDKKRLLAKPGITGLWQVSGRSLLSFDEMVELDLQYIKSISISTDIFILLKTIIVVLKPSGAY